MSGRLVFGASLAICALCTAGTGVAHADSFGPYAGDTLNQLEAWGYNVMLNGVTRDVRYLDQYDRQQCQVTGIHPAVSGPLAAGEFETVYVDLSCLGSNNSNTTSAG